MNHLLFALLLAFAGPSPEQMVEAESLFRDGTVKYESSDYDGAIKSFTEALAIVGENHGADHTRLTLLYNIAKAHEKAFKIDQDVAHLRQAQELYKRYLEFTQTTGNLGDELDVESKLSHLEKQLRIHAQIDANRSQSEESAHTPLPPPPSTGDSDTDWNKPRKAGIGFVAGGSVLTVGGVVLAVVGGTLQGRAEGQVNELADAGIPSDHPAWTEGAQYISQEKRKGLILMGVGGSVAVVGAVGVGLGSYYLVKAKKLREGRVVTLPALSPGYAGVQISGRF